MNLSASNSFAQVESGEVVEELKLQERDHLIYLDQYYKDKTSKEIWLDYIDLIHTEEYPAGLMCQVNEFREPFRSWAVEEVLKSKIDPSGLACFLGGDFVPKTKDMVTSAFIESSLFDAYAHFSKWHIYRTIEVVETMAYGKPNKKDFSSEYVLIDRILNDPASFSLETYYLGRLLRLASVDQKLEIAKRIFGNNPDYWILNDIAGAGIDFYSETAQNIISQANASIHERAELVRLNSVKLSFLRDKMLLKH